MKASEIRKMSATELDTKLHDLKDELFKLRFQQAINQLDNPMRINAVKKDIARIKTVSVISSSTALSRNEREVNCYERKKPQKDARRRCQQRQDGQDRRCYC